MSECFLTDTKNETYQVNNSKSEHSLHVGKISKKISAELWLLNNGEIVRRALSCLLLPQIGDLVTYIEACENSKKRKKTLYILNILERKQNNASVTIQTCSKKPIILSCETLEVNATKNILFHSCGDIDIFSPLGKLSLTVKNMISHVQNMLFAY